MPRDRLKACYPALHETLCFCVRRRCVRLAGEEHTVADLEAPVRDVPESTTEASWYLVGEAPRTGHQRRGAAARVPDDLRGARVEPMER